MNNKALIIFDWDDTLFPTSWLLNNGISLTNMLNIKKFIVYFKELDSIVSKLLIRSLKMGKVIIITNANKDWIKISKYVVPETSKIIDRFIPVISARDLYQQMVDIAKWKTFAFNNNIGNYTQWAKHIISVGDDEYEYNALISLKQYIPYGKILKVIKLIKHPTFDQLIEQLETLRNSLNDICKTRNHLDIGFTNY